MITTIKPTKDLYNMGRCFTKGKYYYVSGGFTNTASLMEVATINDQDQRHIIGGWWRDFEIVE